MIVPMDIDLEFNPMRLAGFRTVRSNELMARYMAKYVRALGA